MYILQSYTHLKTLEYDQKIGYLTPTTEYPGSCVYRCNANKYGISESQVFSTLINRKLNILLVIIFITFYKKTYTTFYTELWKF